MVSENFGKKVFNSLTGGAEIKEVLKKSFFFSLIATLVSIPYFQYLIKAFPESIHMAAEDLTGILALQLFLLFFLCFICSFTGFILSKKHNLPGMGTFKGLKKFLPVLIPVGVSAAVFSYFIFDRYMLYISPRSYPDGVFYIIFFLLKNAIAEELILRLGILTLCIGLFKNKTAGIIITSFIAVLFSFSYLDFIGLTFGLNYILISGVIVTFIINLILGYVFVKRGLISSAFLRLVLGIKYIIIAFL